MFKSIAILDGPIHKGKSFNFSNGVTAIIGANGCGKSLLAEYMAFSLFGSTALRGEVSDYKKLSVEAVITVKGQTYKIKRSTSNCIIYDEQNSEICQGTKPCNARIISLLGYGYPVYKMGNYAEQLDILGLGKMKPRERKAALDQTLGIGIIDKLIKYANDTALKYSHESEAVSSLVVEPGEEPVEPTGYRNSVELAKEYQSLQNKKNDYLRFKEEKIPEKPEPVKDIPELTSISLEDFTKGYIRHKTLQTKYANVCEPVYSEEELENIIKQNEKYAEYQQYLKVYGSIPEPDLSPDSIYEAQSLLNEWNSYELSLKAYNSGVVKCPDCGKVFNPAREAPVEPQKAKPTYTMEYLQQQLTYNKLLESRPEILPVDKPIIDMNMARRYLQDWQLWKEKQDIKDEPAIYTDENYQYRTNYEKEKALYQQKMSYYLQEFHRYETRMSEFEGFNLTNVDVELNNLAILYQTCSNYEKVLADYKIKKARYDEIMEKLNNLKDQEGRYRKATENLKEMKLKIKGYVLPSLQKVSSFLLSEMSDGLFTEVSIDPEFNILVEGRKVDLFSGSEQAMINLALRLGLGQVLTHKSFNVFIGDEIDASMRDDRAQLTADCLKKVSKYINQIILISHRNIEADNYINLGEKK